MKTRTKQFLRFTLTAYSLFWGTAVIFLTLIATGILPISLEGDSPLFLILKIFFSWTPTFAVLLNIKYLLPGTTIKEFYKKVFKGRIRIGMIVFIILLQVVLNIIAGLYVSISDGVPFTSLWHFSLDGALQSAAVCILTGATGEESGWHGYLVPFLAQKRSLVCSGIITGIIWGFWHLPLWLLSGYTGLGLILYISEFMVCTISWALTMGILYDWSENLFIPVFFHFLVNYLLSFFVGNDLKYQISISILSMLTAIGFSIWYHVKKR